METTVPLGRGSQLPSGSNRGGEYASNSPRSSVRASAIAQPLIFKPFSSNFCIVLALANTYFYVISAQDWNFTVPADSNSSCSDTGNFICLGTSHVLTDSVNGKPSGTLSLINDTSTHLPNQLNQSGIAYWRQPVKFWDLLTNKTISFSTHFAIDVVNGIDETNFNSYKGDGVTFVMSANNTLLGSSGAYFGIFNDSVSELGFKTIVVEFDHVWNTAKFSDNNTNHVSIDFRNTTAAISMDAGMVDLSYNFHAWVDYNNETQLLDVSVSADDNRPSSPLLSYKMDLFEVADEYMYVGFTAGSGGQYSYYYLRSWKFGPYEAPPRNPWTFKAIMGFSVAMLAFYLVYMIVIYIFLKRSQRRGGAFEGMPRRFRYHELRAATNYFSKESKLGEGGFGSVYRGVLPSSGRASCTQVAVKKIHAEFNQGQEDFMSEVSIISQLRHKNLIQLLGWCEDTSKEKYLLVYELMPNGSLDKALFGPAETASLSWSLRFNIVSGIAAGLEYLHEGWNKKVIHRDIKSSNIMLDKDWIAKLGDFGLARLVDHQREGSITDPAGTQGYLAPEVIVFHKFTHKTDVYAFGVVVLEVVCGRKALRIDFPNDEIVLVEWVWQRHSEGDLLSTVDKKLKAEYDIHWMTTMMTIGLLCSLPDPECRPSMRLVVQILAGEAPLPSLPPSRPRHAFHAIPLSLISSDKSPNCQVRRTHRSNIATMPLLCTNKGSSSPGLIPTSSVEMQTLRSWPSRALPVGRRISHKILSICRIPAQANLFASSLEGT